MQHFSFLSEFEMEVIDVPAPVFLLFTSQHSRIHRKFTKDGGRTRRWCRGASFQVSLKTACSTLIHQSFPQNTDSPAYTLTTLRAWYCSQSLLHIKDYIGQPCHWHRIHFLMLARPLCPSHTADACSLIDWRPRQPFPSCCVSACKANYFSGDCVFLLRWGAFDRACRWLVCLYPRECLCVWGPHVCIQIEQLGEFK